MKVLKKVERNDDPNKNFGNSPSYGRDLTPALGKNVHTLSPTKKT